MTEPKKTFRYPNGHRMCCSGQDQAAREALALIKGDEKSEAEILDRATKGESALAKQADTNKHNLISWVVYTLFKNGEIENYIDPKTGEYIVTSFSGRTSVKRKVK